LRRSYKREAGNLDVLNFLTDPNPVNTCHEHFGQMFRVYPTVIVDDNLLGWVQRAFDRHSMINILLAFNPMRGQPDNLKKIQCWPSGGARVLSLLTDGISLRTVIKTLAGYGFINQLKNIPCFIYYDYARAQRKQNQGGEELDYKALSFDAKFMLEHYANYIIENLDENPQKLQDDLVNACEQGDLKRVNSLIQSGAKPGISNLAGIQPLYAAVWGMNPEVVSYLCEQKGLEEIAWEKCEQQNLKQYNGIYMVGNFDPKNYAQWYTLLVKMKSPFTQTLHLKIVDQVWRDEDTSSWENLVKWVMSKSETRDLQSLWAFSFSCRNKVFESTETGLSEYRKRIKQTVEKYSSR